jgi:hypothetical protein
MENILNTVFLGAKVKIWAMAFAALAIIVAAVIKISNDRDDKLINTATTAGGSAAVIEGQNAVIEQVGKANDAEKKITRDNADGVYDRCLLNSTEASRPNCQRFRVTPVPR